MCHVEPSVFSFFPLSDLGEIYGTQISIFCLFQFQKNNIWRIEKYFFFHYFLCVDMVLLCGWDLTISCGKIW